MPKKLTVEVAADQFEELCKPSQPLAAVAELIWNGLDAEARTVDVVIDRTDMDAVARVVIVDSGHGLTYVEALRDFGTLGGSWKKGRKLSKNDQRALHGKKGQGRFRAFALGSDAEWTSVAEGIQGLERVAVTGALNRSEFTVSDPERLATGTAGTTVVVTGPRETTGQLLADNAVAWLTSRFAAYLSRYTDVVVSYGGERIDVRNFLEREEDIELDASLGGAHGPPALHVMEWKPEVIGHRSSILLCDADGVALHEITDGVSQAKKFTAYLRWPGFTEYANDLLIGELGHAVLNPIIDAGRLALSTYLEARAADERKGIIEQWKARDVYPFREAAETAVERRERQVFDVIATTAAMAVPSEPKAARLSLRLIRQALEQSPGSLHRVLQEVLDLTVEQVEEFDRLLRTAPLPSVIAATTRVVERLTFLDDLHRLLFDADGKNAVRERGQLHTLLERGRTWVFGEEYGLAVSDKSLTTVLAAHLKLLGDEPPVLASVKDAAGKSRRVDLMLSAIAGSTEGRRHLVVELKRPSVKLGQTELNQITNYALTVAGNAAFKAPDVTWDFWLVGDDYDEYVEAMAHQDNLPVGVVFQKHPYTVRVRRWAEIIEENRQRLHFYKEHLDYQAEDDDSIEATLAKYLGEQSDDPPADT